MGCDYLDICFRIEKKFHIKIGRYDHPWPETPGPHDITAGELAHWVNRMRQMHLHFTPRVEECLWCVRCAADLRGIPVPGYCNRCGRLLNDEEFVWRLTARILVESLAVAEHEVHRDARLIKDLGAS